MSWTPDGIITQGEYQKSKSYGDYEINWSSDNTFMYIGMKAKTAGWVAVGFGAELLMKNADIVEGYLSDGKAVVADMFSTGEFGPHPPDVQQGGTNDILDYGGKRENGATVIEFKRKLDTGDKFDKPLVKGVNKIIWSFGADDQPTNKHVTRGSGEIDL
ncbi:MAG: DOMON domain-containing protein [Chloroflexi bacterium]|nr:DOMON domain-containing protein [Chloroflexota bacterium]